MCLCWLKHIPLLECWSFSTSCVVSSTCPLAATTTVSPKLKCSWRWKRKLCVFVFLCIYFYTAADYLKREGNTFCLCVGLLPVFCFCCCYIYYCSPACLSLFNTPSGFLLSHRVVSNAGICFWNLISSDRGRRSDTYQIIAADMEMIHKKICMASLITPQCCAVLPLIASLFTNAQPLHLRQFHKAPCHSRSVMRRASCMRFHVTLMG